MVWGSPGGREELGAFGTWKRASVAKGQSDGSAKGPSFSEARQCWGETGVGRESVTGGVFGFPGLFKRIRRTASDFAKQIIQGPDVVT